MPRKITREQFIEKAKKAHGNKYDYSKVEYINYSMKVCIICPEHGEFWQSPANHIHKSHPRGCPKCNIYARKNLSDFIQKAKEIHGGKYDYSKTEYIDAKTKVCIICPEHGEFWQSPSNHIHKSHPRGCPKCNGGIRMTMDEFLKKSKEIHGDKYDYSKVDLEHRDSLGRVCIICPEHGEFWQIPSLHAKGTKCKYCAKVGKLNTEDFKKRAKELHGNKYDYSKTEYTIQEESIIITCPIHGDFVQSANSHLHGAGCPHCRISHLELEIESLLKENDIKYKHIARRIDLSWLGRLSLDFYLPDYNMAIECQGIQHFKKVDIFEKGKYGYDSVIKNDKLKRELCEKNGIKLFYYSDLGIDYPYKVFENKNELLNEIIKSNDRNL